jgi:hypothetical protein
MAKDVDVAFLDRSDSVHVLFVRLFAEPPALITSPLVISAGHGWFLRRHDRGRALQFLAPRSTGAKAFPMDSYAAIPPRGRR